jgi:hypothetical protein
MKKLFLAWQNAQTRRWFPIGQLTQEGNTFSFCYIGGVYQAQKEGGFLLFPEFPDVDTHYTSTELFPLFANRVLPSSRPDFFDYIRWLKLEGQEKDALAFLAKTNGRRQTDTLEIFAPVEETPDGNYKTTFFVHGLRHMSPEALCRMEKLKSGETLLLSWEAQNPVDSKAITLRTYSAPSGDATLLGYCPRYLATSIFNALLKNTKSVSVKVLTVNQSPAPSQYGILCELSFSKEMPSPFHGEEFQILN